MLSYLQFGFLPSGLPYSLVGKLTVTVVAGLASLILAGILVILGIMVWVRFFQKIMELMWRGHTTDDPPGVWRLRISGIAFCFSRLKLWKIPVAWREPPELADDGDENSEDEGGDNDGSDQSDSKLQRLRDYAELVYN